MIPARPMWPRLCSRLDLPQGSPAEPLRRSQQAIDLDVPEELFRRQGAVRRVARTQSDRPAL